jgi:hypothetical protein
MTHIELQNRFLEIKKVFSHATGGGMLVLELVPIERYLPCKSRPSWKEFKSEWRICTVERDSVIIGCGSTAEYAIVDAESWLKNRFD